MSKWTHAQRTMLYYWMCSNDSIQEKKEVSNKPGKYITMAEEQPSLSLHMKDDLKLFFKKN